MIIILNNENSDKIYFITGIRTKEKILVSGTYIIVYKSVRDSKTT